MFMVRQKSITPVSAVVYHMYTSIAPGRAKHVSIRQVTYTSSRNYGFDKSPFYWIAYGTLKWAAICIIARGPLATLTRR